MNRLQLVVLSNAFKRKELLSSTNLLSKVSICEKSSKSGPPSSSDSSSSSDSDIEKSRKPKKEEALKKLNFLLNEMLQEDSNKVESKIQLSKPPNKRLKKDGDKGKIKVESIEQQTLKAAKEVAHSIGGDVQQTESELVSKLLNPIGGQNSTTEASLSDIIKGMKIDRETKPAEQSRSDQVRQILQQARSRSKSQEDGQMPRKPRRSFDAARTKPEPVTEKIDLFGGEPLGIFTDKSALKDGPENKTWRALYERELKLSVTHPPANYFQQMILWTEEGKLWKFPIDNEQDLVEESKVYFAEHIFLEGHLEPWCPRKGPIRHFMELVCVGLSKNPYLTVEAKKEHIEWYKNYFESKKQLLIEVGAIPTEQLGKGIADTTK